MSSTQGPHSLAFRVMRLCRPSLLVDPPLLVHPSDLLDHPFPASRLPPLIASHLSDASNPTYRSCFLLRDPADAMGLSSLVLLPQAFGMSISGWVFMISVGLNAAASVRVSNELGAGNPRSAAFSVAVVTVISFSMSVVAVAAALALRGVISYAFTEGAAVVAAVSDLCPLLALTLLLNGIQPVLSACRWKLYSGNWK